MTRHLLPILCCTIGLVVMLAACGGAAPVVEDISPTVSAVEPVKPAGGTATAEGIAFKKSTTAMEPYKTECGQQGTVVALEYDTPAYAINALFGVDETLRKTLHIYLPYGYDPSEQYNILYLLHGTRAADDGPMEEYWLASEQWGQLTRNVLDNMIKEGLCDPVIVVAPSYYSPVEGYPIAEAEGAVLAKALGDSMIGDPEQDIWPLYFGDELRNSIIPAVERQYATYAGGNTETERLVATRDHRAFAGLSRGAMTVVRGGLMTNIDLFAYFGSFSGVWVEFEQFKEALAAETRKDYDIKYWYNGNGYGDFALENHETFKNQVLEQMGDRFVNGKNYGWIVLRDGAHGYSSWLTDLYNTLLVFYK